MKEFLVNSIESGSAAGAALIALVGALVGAIVNFITSVWAERRNQKRFEFEAYWGLFDVLLGSGDEKSPLLHKQVAAVYEMARYKKYKKVTKRILIDLKDRGFNKDEKIFTDELDKSIESLSK